MKKERREECQRLKLTPRLPLHSAEMEMIGRENVRGETQSLSSEHSNSVIALCPISKMSNFKVVAEVQL